MSELPEEIEGLRILTVAPVIWSGPFLLCEHTATIWCAKVAGRHGSLGEVRVVIAVYTALALLGIGITGWLGFRKHRFGPTDVLCQALCA